MDNLSIKDFDILSQQDKAEAIDAVEKGEAKLDLAQRLTRALDSEGGRWLENIGVLEKDYLLLSGDVFLAAEFISYIGPFTKEFREHLLNNCWTPFMQNAAKPFLDAMTDEEKKEEDRPGRDIVRRHPGGIHRQQGVGEDDADTEGEQRAQQHGSESETTGHDQ